MIFGVLHEVVMLHSHCREINLEARRIVSDCLVIRVIRERLESLGILGSAVLLARTHKALGWLTSS